MGCSLVSKVLWDLPDHTVGKHDVLVSYLKAWIPILGQGFGRAVVVDGFSGPGEYRGGEIGSPILAWRVAGEYKRGGKLGQVSLDFHFVDSDPRRVSHLRSFLDGERKYAGMTYSVQSAVCADVLPAILDGCRSSGTPVFVMLDPFGLKGVSMDLITEILSVPHGEVLFSFMHETAVRFNEVPEVHPHLLDLVGDSVPRGSSPQDYCDALEQRFREFGADHVLRFGLWDGGRYIYTLFFGTKSPRGCEVMKDAMWSVSPDGSYNFRGLQRHQALLFGQESSVDFGMLKRDLVDEFGYESWIPIDSLDDFMRSDRTMFRRAHLRSGVLVPLQKEGMIEVRNQERRGSFSPGSDVEVRFPRLLPSAPVQAPVQAKFPF